MRRSRDVIVYLTEPGGDVSVAVQLAFFINMKNLSTAITAWDPPSMNFLYMGNRHHRHSRRNVQTQQQWVLGTCHSVSPLTSSPLDVDICFIRFLQGILAAFQETFQVILWGLTPAVQKSWRRPDLFKASFSTVSEAICCQLNPRNSHSSGIETQHFSWQMPGCPHSCCTWSNGDIAPGEPSRQVCLLEGVGILVIIPIRTRFNRRGQKGNLIGIGASDPFIKISSEQLSSTSGTRMAVPTRPAPQTYVADDSLSSNYRCLRIPLILHLSGHTTNLSNCNYIFRQKREASALQSQAEDSLKLKDILGIPCSRKPSQVQ